MFLSILFWALVLVAAPVAFIRLLLALRGKRIGDTPYCKRCNYNRKGIHPDSPCPECGCGTCDMYGWPNVVTGEKQRTLKRIAMRLTLVVVICSAAWGADWLHDKIEYLPASLNIAAGNGEHTKVRRLAYWFPELADGEFRFTKNHTYPLLFIAVRRDDQVMIDILIKAGANPNGTRLYLNHIPLYEAIQWRSAESCRRLLEAGADPNIQTRGWGPTGLLFMAISGPGASVEKVSLLLEHGADVNVRNEYGNTPLDYVMGNRYIPIQDRQAILDLLGTHGAMTSEELDAQADNDEPDTD